MSPDQRLQEGGAQVWTLRPAGHFTAVALDGPRVTEDTVVVPREVAEHLAEALAVISADTDPPDGAEDSASGLAWRVKLAHETEREFRAVFPEVVESAAVSTPPALGDLCTCATNLRGPCPKHGGPVLP